MINRIFVMLFAALLSVAPAGADQLLPAGRIDNSGTIQFGPLSLGKRQAGKVILTPDALQLGGPLACTTAACLTTGLSVLLPGATTALLYSKYLSLLPIPVEAYGAKGDGSDDAPAINAAIQWACARGGGVVQLMYRHAIGAAIDNNCSGVLVRGIGGPDITHDVGPGRDNTFIYPRPGYVGDGLRHRSKTAAESGLPASQNRIVSGGGFENVTVEAFQRNLHVTSTRRGTYKGTFNDANGTENILFDTLPDFNQGSGAELGEAGDVQQMLMDINFRQYADATTGRTTGNADGVVFSGVGPNISYNEGMRLSGFVQDGVGLRIRNGDNNHFTTFRIGVRGSGKPLYIYPDVDGAGGAANDSNYFDHYFSNVAGYVAGYSEPGVTNGRPPIQTIINYPDLSNSTVMPVAGQGTEIRVGYGYKNWKDWTPTISAASGTFTGASIVYARYKLDPMSNTVHFSLVFNASYTTAPSGLRFTLPLTVRDSGTFASYQGSTGRILVATAVGGGSNLVNIYRDGGLSPLEASGNFYSVSGTYETP